VVDSRPVEESAAIRRRRVYAWGNSLYNFKGLQFAKSRFQGQVVKTYCCHRSLLPSISMLAMFRITRLI
jgi:lysylphosphatidylglycerol synthetase-like protein (DUF2156 family)